MPNPQFCMSLLYSLLANHGSAADSSGF